MLARRRASRLCEAQLLIKCRSYSAANSAMIIGVIFNNFGGAYLQDPISSRLEPVYPACRALYRRRQVKYKNMSQTPKRVRKAVLPVAGLGTRFLPATKAMPKEMLPIVDKPLIQYAVEECIASGIEDIIFVTGRRKNAIEDHFDSAPELESFLEERGKPKQAQMVREISGGLHFSYTRQSEALGLGHAVLCAAELVGDEPFAVLLGDVIMDGLVPATRTLDGYLRGHRHGSDPC